MPAAVSLSRPEAGRALDCRVCCDRKAVLPRLCSSPARVPEALYQAALSAQVDLHFLPHVEDGTVAAEKQHWRLQPGPRRERWSLLPKIKKTCLVARCNNKLQSFCYPPPENNRALHWCPRYDGAGFNPRQWRITSNSAVQTAAALKSSKNRNRIPTVAACILNPCAIANRGTRSASTVTKAWIVNISMNCTDNNISKGTNETAHKICQHQRQMRILLTCDADITRDPRNLLDGRSRKKQVLNIIFFHTTTTFLRSKPKIFSICIRHTTLQKQLFSSNN